MILIGSFFLGWLVYILQDKNGKVGGVSWHTWLVTLVFAPVPAVYSPEFGMNSFVAAGLSVALSLPLMVGVFRNLVYGSRSK